MPSPTPIKDHVALQKLSEDESSPRMNPARFLQTDNRQPPARGFSHQLLSSYVMESLPLVAQRTRRRKKQRSQVAGAEEGVGWLLSPTPTMQQGACGSQAAPHLKLCAGIVSRNRKRKEKQFFLRTTQSFI